MAVGSRHKSTTSDRDEWIKVGKVGESLGPFEQEVIAANLLAESVTITPQEGLRLYDDAAEWWTKFKNSMADDYVQEEPRRRRAGFTAAWKVFGVRWLSRAKELAFYALRFKAAPRGSNKALRIAIQPIIQMRSSPRDVERWVDKNQLGFLQLLKTRNWPAKDGSALLFELNGVTVHNNEGLEGRPLDTIRKLITASCQAIERSGIPKARGIIYGDVVLTAQLLGSHTLAFYRRKQDSIWLSPKTRHGPAQMQSLVHEFGHRYWSFSTFLNPRKKAEWLSHDRAMRARSPEDVRALYPAKGEPLPFKVSGFGGKPPIVVRIEGDRSRGFRFYISDTGFVTSLDLFKHFRQEVTVAMFPTVYSATTDAEEHFCESFGQRCLGTAKEPHKSAFREIIG